MKIYKLVSVQGISPEGDWLASLFRHWGKDVVYEPNKPAVGPDGTFLLAFETLADALDYRRVMAAGQLWEAEGTDVRSVQLLAMWPSDYVRFWKDHHDSSIPAFIAPPGTVACSSITLTQRVK